MTAATPLGRSSFPVVYRLYSSTGELLQATEREARVSPFLTSAAETLLGEKNLDKHQSMCVPPALPIQDVDKEVAIKEEEEEVKRTREEKQTILSVRFAFPVDAESLADLVAFMRYKSGTGNTTLSNTKCSDGDANEVVGGEGGAASEDEDEHNIEDDDDQRDGEFVDWVEAQWRGRIFRLARIAACLDIVRLEQVASRKIAKLLIGLEVERIAHVIKVRTDPSGRPSCAKPAPLPPKFIADVRPMRAFSSVVPAPPVPSVGAHE